MIDNYDFDDDIESCLHCDECGENTRGNYVQCIECDKVLCDACDIRVEDQNEEPMCQEDRLEVFGPDWS